MRFILHASGPRDGRPIELRLALVLVRSGGAISNLNSDICIVFSGCDPDSDGPL